ncbi:MAG TPA: LCP family protein [Microbacteriaceae bacterium]|nr:LCP family protein [Microbacteriaceae bacterium]
MSESPDRAPRRVIPRHARRARPNPAGLIVGVIASVLAVALLSTAAVGAVVWNTFSKRLEATIVKISETDAPPPDIGAIEGGFNILIVGSDTREGGNNIDGSDEGGILNDVNMLLHVAQDQQSAVMIAVPRDLYVGDSTPCAWSKINTSLAAGGFPCAVDTMGGLTGLPIQFAGLITFTGVIAMADAIGGVEVCADAPILDEDTGLNIPEGYSTVTGFYALAFLRTRGGVGDGSDLSRVSSQQVYLSSLIRKVKSDGVLNDPLALLSIAQTALANMTLSGSLADPYTMVQMALALKNLPLNRVTFVRWPTYYGPAPEGETSSSVMTDWGAANELLALIAADQPFVLPAVGDDRGSTIDPNGALTPEQQEQLADNSGLPVLSGVTGQTAADFSCSVAN